MAERASMPTFVPRTVATFERAANQLAHRVTAPLRAMAARAHWLAERVVGSWTGAAPTVGGFGGGERRTLRVADRGGVMVMPRPWYEAVTAVDDVDAVASPRLATAAPTSVAARVIAAAERGAAIARTALTTAPEAAAVRAGDVAAAAVRAGDVAAAAVRGGDVAAAAVRGGDVAAAAVRPAEDARGDTGTAGQPLPSTSTAAVEAASIAAGDLRAADALGLRLPPATAPARATTRATAMVAPGPSATPLARALAHTAWVDAQLRAVTPPAEPVAGRAAAGYVFVAAPDAESATPSMRQSRAAAATAPRAAAPSAAPVSAPAAGAPPEATAHPAAATPVWTAALPDPRLPAGLPSRIAQRVTDFVARLVGVQSARDVTLPPLEAVATLAAVAAAEAGAPTRSPPVGRAPEPTYVSSPPRDGRATATSPTESMSARASLSPPVGVAISWRPGAAAARIEQLGEAVDARVHAAWGLPVVRPRPLLAPLTSLATDRTYVAMADVTPARATGPTRLSQFMDTLVGVQAVRSTAALPLPPASPMAGVAAADALASPQPGAAGASARAPSRVMVTAPAAAAAPATGTLPQTAAASAIDASVRAPSAGAAASMRSARSALAPGGIGLRAEQLAGVVGVRAASLSIEFVDPARLALLTAAPPMPTVGPEAGGEPPLRDTVMPAARPLFAMATTPAAATQSPTLSAAEWSLVATFPSAATAVQLMAARQAADWQGGGTLARAGAGTPRTLVTAAPARQRPWAAAQATSATAAAPALGRAALEVAAAPSFGRAWVDIDGQGALRKKPSAPEGAASQPADPTQLVAPRPATAATPSSTPRLPSGRAPRGSFTWPKLGAFSSAADGWTPSAAVTGAEYANQAAPGTPLWGAMPSLVLSAPTPVATAPLQARSARAEGSASPATNAAAATGPAASARDGAAMTLMTATAMRESRAAARSGDSRDPDAVAPAPTAPMTITPGGSGADRTRAAGAGRASNVRVAPSLGLTTAAPTAPGQGAAATGPSARALELARPFLRLIEGSAASDAARPSTPRFFEQPKPLVSAVPSSDSASRIVEAMRHQPATTRSDDRVSLSDLTLIAMASATQQVAASAAGGGPSASAPAAAAAPTNAPASHGDGGGSGNPAQEIEELARATFEELQRLMEIARERSGDHG